MKVASGGSGSTDLHWTWGLGLRGKEPVKQAKSMLSYYLSIVIDASISWYIVVAEYILRCIAVRRLATYKPMTCPRSAQSYDNLLLTSAEYPDRSRLSPPTVLLFLICLGLLDGNHT